MSLQGLLFVLAAACANVLAVFALKESRGMTLCSPTVLAVTAIVGCHWALAQAMECGGQVGLTVGLNIVLVVAASSVIGHLAYKEPLRAREVAGLAIAAAGILLALTAPARANP